jgi:hypothetical protein
MIRTLIVIFFLIGCATSDSGVLLRWAPDLKKPLVFNTVIQEIPTDDLGLSHGFDVLSDPKLREKIKNKLAELELPAVNNMTSIVTEGDNIRIKMIGKKPTYIKPAKNDIEIMQREVAELNDGKFQLIADIDHSGKLQSFYLKQKQKNLISLFFGLPHDRVEVGDSWSLPMNLIEIGTNFFPTHQGRVNKVFLDEITLSEQGESIATLFYVIAEEVEGQYEYSNTDKKIPMSLAFSYIAYGEFYINKGYWKKFNSIAYLTGSGTSQNKNATIYALTPIEE